MKIIEIQLDKIKPDPNQPRKTFNKDKIEELAATIRTVGVINPIEVDEDFMIITGENRWKAAQEAGLTKTWVKVLDIDNKDRFIRQVIENIQYANLTPHEIAEALIKLLNLSPGNRLVGKDAGISKLAEMIGKSRAWISQHLDLLEASKEFQTAVKKGLPFRNIRALSQIPEPFKKQLEKKILSGEIASASAAQEIASAISRNPLMGKEIISKNFSKYETGPQVAEVLSKLSPRFSDMISLGQKPIDQLSQIDKLLSEWLKLNTPQSIGNLRLGTVLLILSTLKDRINQWK